MTVDDAVEQLFAGAYRAGVESAGAIKAEMDQLGVPSTLGNEQCIDLFAAEWLFVRLIFIEHLAQTFKDSSLQSRFIACVAKEIDHLKSTLFQGQEAYDSNVFFLKQVLSNSALPPIGSGPGWGLSQRYDLIISAIADDLGISKPASQELIAIALIGDKALWHCEGDLETVLKQAIGKLQ